LQNNNFPPKPVGWYSLEAALAIRSR
jgi:hypothetical protein